jgi:cellulose synthase operon protein C
MREGYNVCMEKLWMHIIIGVAGIVLVGSVGVAQDVAQPPVEPIVEDVEVVESPAEPVVEDVEVVDAPVMDAETLDAKRTKAHEDYVAGRYLPAIRTYGEILSDFPDDIRAATGQAIAQRALGRYDKAIETLDADPAPEDAEWLLARAGVFEAVGRYEEALADAQAAYELNALWAPAVRDYGRLLELFGRDAEALTIFEQVEAIVAAGDYRTDAAELTAVGEIMETYSQMKGLRASVQANNIFNNYFQVAYQDVDIEYWPAHMAAGWFAIEKHRFKTATNEFNAALLINPNIAEAQLGLAQIALMQWNFEGALEYIQLALATNSDLADAYALQGACFMQWRRYDQAETSITKALLKNPNHIEALSLAAAMAIRDRDDDAAAPYIAKIDAINPQCETLPLMVAEWLSAGRQFDTAEGYYQQAIVMAPTNASAWTGLGQLYMQTGEEAEAKTAFEKAHEIDDFRADIVNFLSLLDDMENYSVLETEHFIIKVDGEYDEVLLDLVGKEAEAIYHDVCTDFAHEPAKKTIVEIFPDHTDFSVRLTGRGWLGTVGASTGRVIVLVTPHETRGDFGTYNWANVLRHEFAHTVTLSATDNRIPHWFTEACAVWQQPDRQNFEAIAQLTQAVREDRLFPIRELDWGFVRPRRRGDRSLAYAQSEWIFEYIVETQGFTKISEMLDGFREGKTQKEVFAEVLGTTEHGFNQAFKRWAREEVKDWGFDAVPTDDLGKIAAAVQRRPNDVELQAIYAAVLYREGDLESALAAANKAIALDARNVKALEVLSLVYRAQEDKVNALAYARQLVMVDPTSAIAPRVMAEIFIEERQWAAAIIALEQVQQYRPMDPFSYEQLASVYRQLGQADKELPNLIELHQRSMMDPEYARRIADIYNAAREEELARHYYEQVTHIDPYEIGAHESLAAIHRNAGRYDEAIASAGRLVMLEDSAENWAKLAMVRFVAGRNQEDLSVVYQARDDAAHSIELDAEGDGDKVLRQIERYLETHDPEGLAAPVVEPTDDVTEEPTDESADEMTDDASATDADDETTPDEGDESP